MVDSAADLVPARPSLPKLREAAAGCRACPLWEDATQTVFGAGTRSSVAMFVGEQPGDREDREGAPFVGPAGRLLDEALGLAGIDRRAVYVTNAVKHFKWEPRGKRRIHAKPSSPSCGRPCSCASARRLRSHCSAASSGSRCSEGNGSTPTSPST